MTDLPESLLRLANRKGSVLCTILTLGQMISLGTSKVFPMTGDSPIDQATYDEAMMECEQRLDALIKLTNSLLLSEYGVCSFSSWNALKNLVRLSGDTGFNDWFLNGPIKGTSDYYYLRTEEDAYARS